MDLSNPPNGSHCLTDEQLAELADGLAPSGVRVAYEAHLAQCKACTAIADALASARTHLSAALFRAPEEALAPGARVGRYEIRERLGAGGMGTVYAAHDPALDRRVALKLIRAQLAGPELEVRLLREAKAMARLSHPEVIAVHDAGRDGDRLFLAMELVEGGRSGSGRRRRRGAGGRS